MFQVPTQNVGILKIPATRTIRSWGILELEAGVLGLVDNTSAYASACALRAPADRSLRRILKITSTRTQRSWVIVGHPSAADLPRQSRGLLENLVVGYGCADHEQSLVAADFTSAITEMDFYHQLSN
jgi:hypothetical protein